MNDVLDPEKEDTTAEEKEEEAQDSVTDDNSQQSNDEDTSNINWEERYKGLQRATEKKRNDLESQLTKAKADLETTVTELESFKSDAGSLDSKRKEAEDAKTTLENQISDLTSKNEVLEKQLNQQNLIMSEFPQLAPLAKFIPNAEDEEAFRKTASEFNDALTQYIDKGVDASLKGASATFEKGDDEKLVDQSELDKAWDVVYKWGGIPGHEEEVEAANALIQNKQPDVDL